MHSHLSCVYHRKKSLIFDASDIFSNCGEYDMKLSLLSLGALVIAGLEDGDDREGSN